MPQVRVDILIKRLKGIVARLHAVYISCNNFELAGAMLQQIISLEAMIAELMPLLAD